MTKSERFRNVIACFEEHIPVAETELKYINPYQLLVAVILSAQCTDKRVNLITPQFFGIFPEAEILAKASVDEVYEYIKTCSYPNNKAKHLVGMAKMLCSEFKGIVPDDIEKLQKLPGVGRKTANIIASVVYNKPTLAVDTHVFRVSARIGLTTGARTPFEAEMQLLKHIPKKKIPISHHWLILHGRYICKARKPICNQCFLTEYCKYFEKLVKN